MSKSTNCSSLHLSNFQHSTKLRPWNGSFRPLNNIFFKKINLAYLSCLLISQFFPGLLAIVIDQEFVLCVDMLKNVFQDSLSRKIGILLFQT